LCDTAGMAKKKIKRRPPRDVNQLAHYLVNLSTAEERQKPSRKPRVTEGVGSAAGGGSGDAAGAVAG
jgi:hypothetical protein